MTPVLAIRDEISNLEALAGENGFPEPIAILVRRLVRSPISPANQESLSTATRLVGRIKTALDSFIEYAYARDSDEFIPWSVTAASNTVDELVALLDNPGPVQQIATASSSRDDMRTEETVAAGGLAAKSNQSGMLPPVPETTSGGRDTDAAIKESPSRDNVESHLHDQVPAHAVQSDPRNVFVVHGRNLKARHAMFEFLRALGLIPIEWEHAVMLSGAVAPYIGQVLDSAFSRAQAVVVVLTGDDEARLREQFRTIDDDDELRPQPRPNVLFEAGMAFGLHPEKTVLVELGSMRPFSDVAGRHALRFTDSPKSRQELRSRLEQCGCPVIATGTDWLTSGNFRLALRESGRSRSGAPHKRRRGINAASKRGAGDEGVQEASESEPSDRSPTSRKRLAVVPSFRVGEDPAGLDSRGAVYLVVGNYGEATALDVRLHFVDPLLAAEGHNVSAGPQLSRPIPVLKPGEEERFYVDRFYDLYLPWGMRLLRGAYRVDVTTKDPLTGDSEKQRHTAALDPVFPSERVGPWIDASTRRPVPTNHPRVRPSVDPHPDNIAAESEPADGAGSASEARAQE